MKKKILILGSTGMLGNAVAKYFLEKDTYDVTLTYRSKEVAFGNKTIKFDAVCDDVNSLDSDFDYVINCIGVIKPFMKSDPISAIKINCLFPWQLSKWCKAKGIRLFHITTDCVYSGTKGSYKESDLHDALDEYGKSKSLGECESAMLLRTSIIGEEIHKNASLVEWVRSQKGKTVRGYSNHYWNGITTTEYAKICDKIMQGDLYEEGLFHVFAKEAVSKLRMLELFDKKYNLGLTIEAFEPEPVDRTLATDKELCDKLDVPSVAQMIEEM